MKDYNIRASKVKSLIRHWRAKGITPGDTMKLMMLYLGIDRFLHAGAMVYPKTQFNKMRKDLGFKTVTAMLDVIRQSESFQIIRHRADNHVVAIVSPAFKSTQGIGDNLYVEPIGYKEPGKTIANNDQIVANSDSLYLNNISKDIYKDISDNTSSNINNNIDAIEWQGLDEMPLPKLDEKLFHKEPLEDAKEVVAYYFYELAFDAKRMNDIFQYMLDELYERCGKDNYLMGRVLDKYLEDRVEPVFARRKGIENWRQHQIDAWLRSRHQQKLAHVKCDEAIKNWQLKYAKDEEGFGRHLT